ncbi:Muscle-specific protein 20 [Halotydeus destructor]|nr:Muscle-specific protein 20 [Halotydeus destructor]
MATATVDMNGNDTSKLNSKYDLELASELLDWIKELTQDDKIDTNGSLDNFFETLRDGQVLCRLANVFKPDAIPEKRIYKGKMAFKCMENIEQFLKLALEFGVASQETFQTIDLWERHNLNGVIICLQSLARKAYKHGLKGLGPKEAESNVRHFTEEQLRAGRGVISLQYGSNKGATQSGIVMGNTRHM